jgi:copper chaperone CopZ
MKKIMTIEGMSCGHCVMRVTKALEEIPGVSNAKVNLLDGKASVEGEDLDPNLLRGAVIKAGYTVVSVVP